MLSHKKRPVQSMPKPAPAIPPGMRPYMVNLTSLSFSPKTPRSQVVSAYSAQTAEFFQRLRAALEKSGLTNQVAGFGEAGGVPVVTLTCTPAVAALIETLPGVSGVYPDDTGTLGFLSYKVE